MYFSLFVNIIPSIDDSREEFFAPSVVATNGGSVVIMTIKVTYICELYFRNFTNSCAICKITKIKLTNICNVIVHNV